MDEVPWAHPGEAAVIGLDTPVLLALLEGEKAARQLLKRLEGEEICSTAASVFELEAVARAQGKAGLEHRLATLERLRRRLTVVPIDERAAAAAAVAWARDGTKSAGQGLSWMILGALEASGCTEFVTTLSAHLPRQSGTLKITILRPHKPKNA